MSRKEAKSKRLEEVLAIYGANPARWPNRERAGLERLRRSDRAAACAVAEAAALEKVMSRAPGGVASAALRQRIVAAALADGSREARVVPIDSARARKPGAGRARGALWPAAALAASFVLGLYLGLGGLGSSTLDRALDYAAYAGGPDEGETIEMLGAGSERDGLL